MSDLLPLPEPASIAQALRHSIRTASNDDLSEPMTEKRTRHVARIEAMHAAVEYLEGALAERLAERERCIAAIQSVAFNGCHEWVRETVEKCAAAIRAQP